jgi:hypothetical protein
VDRPDDMRVFAKGGGRRQLRRRRGAARYCRQQAAAAPSVIAPPLGAEASGCAIELAQGIGCAQPKPKILFYQGSRIAVSPSAHGRGGVKIARMCHRIAVLFATVAAGGSLLRSPLAAPSASTAMNTQRSQAAATSRPLGIR